MKIIRLDTMNRKYMGVGYIEDRFIDYLYIFRSLMQNLAAAGIRQAHATAAGDADRRDMNPKTYTYETAEFEVGHPMVFNFHPCHHGFEETLELHRCVGDEKNFERAHGAYHGHFYTTPEDLAMIKALHRKLFLHGPSYLRHGHWARDCLRADWGSPLHDALVAMVHNEYGGGWTWGVYPVCWTCSCWQNRDEGGCFGANRQCAYHADPDHRRAWADAIAHFVVVSEIKL